MDNADNSQDDEALLEHVIAACQSAIASAMANPSQALGLARGLEGALNTLTLVSRELEKGDGGLTGVQTNAEPMVRSALESVFAYAGDSKKTGKAFDAVPKVMPQPGQIDTAQTATVEPTPTRASTALLFSEVSRDYITMRETVRRIASTSSASVMPEPSSASAIHGSSATVSAISSTWRAPAVIALSMTSAIAVSRL